MWILGSLKKEIVFLYIPGLIGLALAYSYPQLGETSVLYGLFATAIVDSGHVYTTAWRTWLNPSERKSHPGYWIVPILIFLIFSSWFFFQLPGLWKFVVYATLYHHVRQVYGFSKWYQVLNRRTDKVSDYFLYALAALPFLIYHFRSDAMTSYYSQSDIFVYPHEGILKGLFIVYALLVLGWLSYEWSLWNKGVREVNRIVSVGFPSLIYGCCFFFGKTFTQIIFPMLFVHGIAYCAVVGQSLERTQRDRFKSFLTAFLAVAGTAVIFGLGEAWFEDNILSYDFDAGMNPELLLSSLVVGIYLTPLFSHYVFDAWIWKKNHREAQAVFAAK